MQNKYRFDMRVSFQPMTTLLAVHCRAFAGALGGWQAQGITAADIDISKRYWLPIVVWTYVLPADRPFRSGTTRLAA
nr:hypothetical protein CIT39_03365 [Bradyrhizobium symbiodeficiens]